MPRSVTITTGARLHFGLLANGREQGRTFGGLGLMLREPQVVLEARSGADVDSFHGLQADAIERVAEFVSRYRDWSALHLGSPWVVPPCSWALHSAIPSHAGLGSGTQLALAVAAAAAAHHESEVAESDGNKKVVTELNSEGTGVSSAALLNCNSISVRRRRTTAIQLAHRVQRGARSALGIHGFEYGGLIVEGGKHDLKSVSPLVIRQQFPKEWRCLLIRTADGTGLHAAEERAGFKSLNPMPQALTDKLCGLVVMRLIPAVCESAFDEFAAALEEYGSAVGEYFSPVQGGTFADHRIAACVQQLKTAGFNAAAQSSWGPTIAVFAESETAVRELQQFVSASAAKSGDPIITQITSAMNEPAQVDVACDD